MIKYLISDGKNKGIILEVKEGTDLYQVKKMANNYFYEPFISKNDLCQVQPYVKNEHYLKNRLFKKIQFHTLGGLVTQYNKTIDAEPTQDQINFLDRPINYIKFFN